MVNSASIVEVTKQITSSYEETANRNKNGKALFSKLLTISWYLHLRLRYKLSIIILLMVLFDRFVFITENPSGTAYDLLGADDVFNNHVVAPVKTGFDFSKACRS